MHLLDEFAGITVYQPTSIFMDYVGSNSSYGPNIDHKGGGYGIGLDFARGSFTIRSDGSGSGISVYLTLRNADLHRYIRFKIQD